MDRNIKISLMTGAALALSVPAAAADQGDRFERRSRVERQEPQHSENRDRRFEVRRAERDDNSDHGPDVVQTPQPQAAPPVIDAGAAHRIGRGEGWREGRDRSVVRRGEHRAEHRAEHRDDRSDDRRDDHVDNRHDRPRGDSDHWRNRDRPHHVIVRPSPHYAYRPHWWGSRFVYDNRYRNDYDYNDYYRPGYGFFGSQHGSGWASLYPWLRQDAAGRHWVMWNFDHDRNGRLGREEARYANRQFERLADRNRDGYLSDREISRGIDDLRDEYRYSFRYG